MDQVIIDLAPLRLHGLFETDASVEEFLIQRKTDMLREAYHAGMELRESIHWEDEEEDDQVENNNADMEDEEENIDGSSTSYTITILESAQKAWATQPIWKLPVISMGVFEGERSKAKTMAAALAKAWEIPEPEAPPSQGDAKNRRTAGAKTGGRTKMNGLSEKWRRRHRQALL